MNLFLRILICVTVGLLIGTFLHSCSTIETYPSMVVKKLEYKYLEGKQADIPLYNPIVRLTDKDGKSFCSGFVIDPHYLITAAHCLHKKGVLRKEVIKVFDAATTDTGVEAYAAGFADRSDLGLVQGDFASFRYLKAEFNHFGFMSPAYAACGYAYGSKQMSCNLFQPRGNLFFGVQGRGYLVPGMSGGPVVDMETGVAVGINTGSLEDGVVVSPLQGALGAFGID